MFGDFHDEDEWTIIIQEANVYNSTENFARGLGNIHTFALSNILKRPIILLDAMKGIENFADYSAIFVPVLVEPKDCVNNPPICIAWNSSAHNHYVPLVAIENCEPPALPADVLPRVWGNFPDELVNKYLNINKDDNSLPIFKGKSLTQRLVISILQLISVSILLLVILKNLRYQCTVCFWMLIMFLLIL